MYLMAYRPAYTETACKALFDAEKMHKLLTSMTGKTREESNLLYRIEKDRNGLPIIFVQNDFPLASTEDMKLVKEPLNLERLIDSRNEITMSLVAAPLIHSNNCRKLISDSDSRIKWVSDRMSGIEIGSIRETGKRHVDILGHTDKGGKASLDLYEFKVIGHIVDKEAFKKLWQKGIGMEKCYGSGLMLVM